MRVHKSLVGGNLHLFAGDFNIPLKTGERGIGLVHNFGDVAVPLEVPSDGDPKVLRVIHHLKCVTSQRVRCFHNVDLSLRGYSEDLALSRMEFHLPVVLPAYQSIKVTLEAWSVRQVVNNHIRDGVISE